MPAHKIPLEERFWSKVGPPDANGCRRWQSCHDKDGYGMLGERRSGGAGVSWRKAHQLAYMLSRGESHTENVNHTRNCLYRDCCEPTHLYAGTQLQNIADMVAVGHSNPGKLSPAQVAFIVSSDLPHAELARRFGVSLQAIRHRRLRAREPISV